MLDEINDLPFRQARAQNTSLQTKIMTDVCTVEVSLPNKEPLVKQGVSVFGGQKEHRVGVRVIDASTTRCRSLRKASTQ